MSHRPNHQAPSPLTVFRAQLALIIAPPRRGLFLGLGYLLGQSLLLASTGILLGVQITITGSDATFEMPRLSAVGVEHGLGAWAFAVASLALVGIFFNGRVWRGAEGALRHYHWALPVEKRLHDLLRVAAGSVGLGAICAIFLAATAIVATLSGHAQEIALFPFSAWVSALLGPQVLYLLFAALNIASQGHRWRWVLLIWGGWMVLFATVGAMVGEPFLLALTRIIWGPFGLVTAIAGPTLAVLLEGHAEVPGPWLPAFTLWALMALVSVTAAASSRPRDS